MEIIHFGEFVLEKEGEKHKYYRLVLSTDCGYIIKKLAPECYFFLCENFEHYKSLEITKLLYDDFSRVADILE